MESMSLPPEESKKLRFQGAAGRKCGGSWLERVRGLGRALGLPSWKVQGRQGSVWTGGKSVTGCLNV